MKEEVRITEQVENEKTPILSLSVTNLDVEAEEGKVYRDTFIIESENKVPIEGHICSTCDKVAVDAENLSGVRQEIPWHFRGKLMAAGSSFEGAFVLVTNGGEYTVPYHIRVVQRFAETSIGRISTMDEFIELYGKDRKEAGNLFFLPEFEDIFLPADPEERFLYHSLMKSRSRSLILEEFLTAAGYKEPAYLEIAGDNISMKDGETRGTVELALAADGYLEGTVRSEKGFLQLSHSRFTSDDFTDGRLLITVERAAGSASGSDVIEVDTVRQNLRIPAEWWTVKGDSGKERELRLRIKKKRAELMHNYLYFRTGSIEFDDFAEDSDQALRELYQLTGDRRWKLCGMHFLLMQEQNEAAKEVMAELDEMGKKETFSSLEENYFLYLKAMYYRTPEAISRAVSGIREFYETSENKAEALWMLIYLDREYVYNKRLQYDTIHQLFEEGNNSSLLYFEACEILNENPDYMEELGKFEISVFLWGVRYGYISLSLSYQFARLALKMKFFNKTVFYIAEKLYRVEPDEQFLQVICSLLIKGNRTGKEYHEYFRLAVEANLKIIGLNEFFIRSMDFEIYDIIPQRVLIYFTYSNSLDYLEKAYLYTNVLKNKDSYEEVYGAYHSKMLPFVEEQLLKGRINEHLAYLYRFFQKEVLEKPDNWKAVCDVLFYQRLCCDNRHIIGVYVACPETGGEKYYPLSGKTACVQVYNQRTKFYFVDNSEQRYVTGIRYELKEFLSADQFAPDWIRRNLGNKKVLLMESGRLDDAVEQNILPVLQRIVFDDDFAPWMQKNAIEKLLVYYENHQDKENLARWLEKIDYSNITPEFRKNLIDYYMEVGMLENAFFGVELYGCDIMGAAKKLKLASFGTRYCQGKADETTLFLARSAFVRKKYNKDTLSYLMKYFRGETADLLLIWERSKKFELDTTEFERKILTQVMFTGNDTTDVFPVFESFYESNEGDDLIDEYLEYASMKELESSMELTDSMHMAIGREIVEGRMENRRSRIHFLYYFAGKSEWHDRIKDTAVYIIQGFLQEEFYLPVYHAYRQWAVLPIHYREMTFLTYRGQPDGEVILTYEIDGEEDSTRVRTLTEVLPGMYVCHMHFFQKDHVKYSLEENGTVVKGRDALEFETFEYGTGENSRFFTLNHLDREDAATEELYDYLQKAFFADRYARLL